METNLFQTFWKDMITNATESVKSLDTCTYNNSLNLPVVAFIKIFRFKITGM